MDVIRRGWFGGVVLAGIIFTVWLYYPGYISYDAIDQLTQARAGELRDWHPPLMAYLWGGLDRLVAGPALMLWWQVGMFWGGLGLLAAGVRGWRRLLVVGVVVLTPPILASLGTIWKDSAFAAALLFAAGLLALSARQVRPRWAWLALAPLFYAVALRHNAAPAVLPFLVWGVWLVAGARLRPATWRHHLTALVAATGLLGVMVLAVLWLNSRLIAYPTYPFQQLWAHDVVAISLAEQRVLLPPELNDPPFTVEQLSAIYTPDSVVPLFCCTPEPRRIEQVRYLTRGYKVDALFAQWLSVVPQNIPAYISHRSRALAAMVGWGRAEVCLPFETKVEPSPLNVDFNPPPLNRWLLESVFLPLQNSLWFRAWVYWAANTALLGGILLFRPMRRAPMVVLVSSSALYMLPYLVATTQCDLRFSWWLLVATVTAGALYLGMERRKGTDAATVEL